MGHSERKRLPVQVPKTTSKVKTRSKVAKVEKEPKIDPAELSLQAIAAELRAGITPVGGKASEPSVNFVAEALNLPKSAGKVAVIPRATSAGISRLAAVPKSKSKSKTKSKSKSKSTKPQPAAASSEAQPAAASSQAQVARELSAAQAETADVPLARRSPKKSRSKKKKKKESPKPESQKQENPAPVLATPAGVPVPAISEQSERQRFHWKILFTRQWVMRNTGVVTSLVLHTVLMLALSLIFFQAGIGDSRIFLDLSDAPAANDDNDLLEVDLAGLEGDFDLDDLGSDAEEESLQDELEQEDATDPLSLAELGASAENASASASNGRQGDGKSATFFGTRAKGNRFVFLVDRSGSMEYGKRDRRSRLAFNRYDVAVAELLDAVSSLQPHQEFLVAMFAQDTRVMFDPKRRKKPTLVPATESNKRRLRDWVERQTLGWGTDPREGLKLAFALKPDAIFLLSDGAFVNEQGDDKPKTRDIARKNSGRLGAIPVNTVALEGESSRESLQEIAEITRGAFRFQSIDKYVADVLAGGKNGIQLRAISWALQGQKNIALERRLEIIDQLASFIDSGQAENRFIAEKLIHQATFEMFEGEVEPVNAGNRKQISGTWKRIASEMQGYRKTGQVSALDPELADSQKLCMSIAGNEIDTYLSLLESGDPQKLQPRAMLRLMLGVLEQQEQAGPTPQSIGWIRYLGRRLDGRKPTESDRQKLGKSQWSHAQTRSWVEDLLAKRTKRSQNLFEKVADAKKPWPQREKLAWQLLKKYPESEESVKTLEIIRQNIDQADDVGNGDALTVEKLLSFSF